MRIGHKTALFIMMIIATLFASNVQAKTVTTELPMIGTEACKDAVSEMQLRTHRLTRGTAGKRVLESTLIAAGTPQFKAQSLGDVLVAYTDGIYGPKGTCGFYNRRFMYEISGQSYMDEQGLPHIGRYREGLSYESPQRRLPSDHKMWAAKGDSIGKTVFLPVPYGACDRDLAECKTAYESEKARANQLALTVCNADGWSDYDANTGKCAGTRTTTTPPVAAKAQSAITTMTASSPRGQATSVSGLATAKGNSFYMIGFWTLLVILWGTIVVFVWLMSERVPRQHFLEAERVIASLQESLDHREKSARKAKSLLGVDDPDIDVLDATRIHRNAILAACQTPEKQRLDAVMTVEVRALAAKYAQMQSYLSIVKSQNKALREDESNLSNERDDLAKRVRELTAERDEQAKKMTELSSAADQVRKDMERALENIKIANALVPILQQGADDLRKSLEKKKLNKAARQAVAAMLDIVNPQETTAPPPPPN